jgi:hypothetical protein
MGMDLGIVQTMKSIVIALSTLLVAIACAPPPVGAPGNFTEEQAQALYGGRLTVFEYRAINAALPELERNRQRLDQYQKIRVRQYYGEIYVVFYQRDGAGLGNSARGSEALDLEVRLAPDDLRILGSHYSR